MASDSSAVLVLSMQHLLGDCHSTLTLLGFVMLNVGEHYLRVNPSPVKPIYDGLIAAVSDLSEPFPSAHFR
jgi:hypothetical protein